MSIQGGDIAIMYHVPADDPTAAKERPCLVVSGRSYNQRNVDVIVVAMSSVLRSGDQTQIVIADDDPSFPATGLRYSSAIKCGAIFAYPRAKIRRRLGVVPAEVLTRVRGIIIEALTE